VTIKIMTIYKRTIVQTRSLSTFSIIKGELIKEFA
jgi:hypothetical protein